MTLTFKTKNGDKPTDFVAKIWAGLLSNEQNYVTTFFT